MRRLLAFATVSVVPTAVDVGLLVALRQGLGWPLVVADALAIAVASVVSYGLHRVATFRSTPYFRWVRQPLAFAVIAAIAGVVDVVVLRLTFTAAGYTTVGGLLVAKAVSLAAAAALRALGYRWVLQESIRDARAHPSARPLLDGACRLSVVVPAYREPDRIGASVQRIHDELADVAADGGLEVVVVDDGSGDATADAALAAGADQVVVLPRNRGKGGAVRAGVLASRGRVVLFTDADLAYDPPQLREAMRRIEAGWDVVIGSRRHPQSVVARSTGLRAVGSRVVNRLSTAVLLAAPRDTQCGLKAFRGDVARTLFRHTRVDGFAFDIEVLHLVERAELSLAELPVRLDETGESSTVRIGRDVVQLSMDLLRVRRWSSTGAYDDVADALARVAR
ncbi:MAG TPA: glycosyltransferase [Acidimicrobiales bacterium]|nr:glycosyltransferase [Acidimicrobiales bacterium]